MQCEMGGNVSAQHDEGYHDDGGHCNGEYEVIYFSHFKIRHFEGGIPILDIQNEMAQLKGLLGLN